MFASRTTGHGASDGCPARWTIASTPAIAASRSAAEVMSPTTPSGVCTRSKPRNCQPKAGSRSRSAVPIRPAAPVTRTVVIGAG
jgi:hypothetical protein